MTESDDGEGCSLWTGPGGVTLGGGVWGFNVWVENEHGSRIYTGTSLPLSLVPFTSLAGCWRRRSGFSPGAGCSVETFFFPFPACGRDEWVSWKLRAAGRRWSATGRGDVCRAEGWR